MMKTTKKINFNRAGSKNILAFLALGILALNLPSNVSAAEKTHISKAKIFEKTVSDTTKMVSGVPLKPEDVSPLLVGEKIPTLILSNDKGESVDLNKVVAEKPTILVFYRGGWCPFCSKQLAGLQEIQKDLTDMGYQVIAVSTDSPENLTKTMTKEKLSYTLLSDADLSASKKFGIAYKSPANYDSFLPAASGGRNVDKLLPVPSVFILNKVGEIAFEYINPNFKQRISSSLMKAAAESLRNQN
ncbi:peroxiredoxin [Pedobacter sp. UYP30]|uniref:peroxiredoxin family protein n=1 Tax=Pedobacter sp. UYP30 TaxID=1756400 RepID=UPI00339250F6